MVTQWLCFLFRPPTSVPFYSKNSTSIYRNREVALSEDNYVTYLLLQFVRNWSVLRGGGGWGGGGRDTHRASSSRLLHSCITAVEGKFTKFDPPEGYDQNSFTMYSSARSGSIPINMPMLGRRWANVGPTICQPLVRRWANVPMSTCPNIGPMLGT